MITFARMLSKVNWTALRKQTDAIREILRSIDIAMLQQITMELNSVSSIIHDCKEISIATKPSIVYCTIGILSLTHFD